MVSVKGGDRNVPILLSRPRIATLLGSILVGLCTGTNYIYSAYAPQLGARLHISHTQINIVGLAANVGGTLSAPLLGRFVDAKGATIPLIGASVCLLVGYTGIQRIYDNGIGTETSISTVSFSMLIVCLLLNGLATGGASAAINTTAKSFPKSAHATTTGLVLSGYGLSAFVFSTIAHAFFPGDTSALLRLLALGTSIPILVALLFVQHVPLPPNCSTPVVNGNEGYELIPTGDVIPLSPEDELEGGGHHSLEPSPAIEMGWVTDQSDSPDDGSPDIHGVQLLTNPDFYLLVAITSLLSGTGIMYINNVGSIALALYAQSNAEYDHVEASKWQVAQVSTLSLGNFAGRVIIGLTSDFIRSRLHIPRTYCLCIVSSTFIISQVFSLNVSSVSALWMATALLGFAYGSLWGSMTAIMIDWFGLNHLAENSGWASFAPFVGGNVFSIMIGRDLDAHTPTPENSVLEASTAFRRAMSAWTVLVREPSQWIEPRAGIPSEHQCILGRECYVSSLQVTLVSCIVALALSTWAGIRDGRRNKVARNV